MRFLRGFGIGIIGFIICMVAMFVIMGNTTGFGGEEEFSLDYAFQEVPEWTGILLVGMFVMIFGPIYYWLLEPILQKRKKATPYEP